MKTGFYRFLVGALISVSAMPIAHAQTFVAPAATDYTARGIKVSATADDATTARMQAMTQAEGDGFTQLLQQLLPPDQAASKRQAISPDGISRMVRSYSVHGEKTGSKSYSALVDVAFDPKQVTAFLGSTTTIISNISGNKAVQALTASAQTGGDSEASPEPAGYVYSPSAKGMVSAAPTNALAGQQVMSNSVLVVPVLKTGAQIQLWEGGNNWRDALNQAQRSNKNAVRLPIGDDSDKLVMDSGQILTAPKEALQPLAQRYQAGTVIVAIASPREYTSGSKLDVMLHRVETNGEVHDTPVTYEGSLNEMPDELLKRAAQDIISRLEAEHVPATPANNSTSALSQAGAGQMTIISQLSDLHQWVGLRRRLQSLPNVTKLELSALSDSQVDMVLSFRGSADQLAAAMQAQGLHVQKATGYWIVAP